LEEAAAARRDAAWRRRKAAQAWRAKHKARANTQSRAAKALDFYADALEDGRLAWPINRRAAIGLPSEIPAP
jgi:hypothetical protein